MSALKTVMIEDHQSPERLARLLQGMPKDDVRYRFQEDIDAINAIAAVPTMLKILASTTKMGFAAVARVTPERWVCLAVHDAINFGLKPGSELPVKSTLCDEIRQDRQAIVIDHVAESQDYCDHHTPATYGFQSYISMPIFLRDGSFHGTLCAIDPKPAKLSDPTVIGMFRMFADLIAFHLEANKNLTRIEASLSDVQATKEMQDHFIAALGHDLRNPIGAIVSGAKLLRRSNLDQRQLAISQAIENSAGRMTRLVEDITDLSRGQIGSGISLRMSTEGLESALRHAVEELRLSYPERAIELSVSLTSAVKVDSAYMARLLSNLLKNALTYGSQTDPVKVEISSAKDFNLSVSNQGNPIPVEVQNSLFAAFTRGPTRGDHQGLGLGLYIVDEIAHAHGGDVTITSTPDETRFTFRMPIKD